MSMTDEAMRDLAHRLTVAMSQMAVAMTQIADGIEYGIIDLPQAGDIIRTIADRMTQAAREMSA